MEEIKPKKERKFLKGMGDIALVLFRELVLGIGKKVINKVGNKRQGLVITFVILASTFAIAQFPNTTNKQRLGFQTTADGLVWRGSISDTASIQPVNNQNAWVILDTINLKFYTFDFTSNVWNLVVGALTMPFDSITFNTAKNGTVGVGEVEYNDTQGSLIQGLKGGNVNNVIGQQLHQRVNNRTGATLNKGDVVYLAGSQGNRITVAKGLAVTDAFSANTFGVVAESIPDNQSGFIITEGLITGLNTSALTEDSAVYLSPTVPGALTSTKPQAPQHTVYIGVCVKSNNGSGELFIKIRNGQELDELHDTRITFPLEKASLYYSGGLWRDTTAALLVSDTASMLSNYATKAYADTTGRLYARQDFTNVSSSTLTWTQSDTLIPEGVNVVQVYRNGQILLPTQYTIPTSTSVVIAASSFKVNDNYTVIFPRGGGAGSGGGSGSLTSISGGTGITVSPNPITTTGTVSADLSVLMELTDTSLLNLSTRFASKLNTTDTASLSNRIDAKGTGTVTSVATGYGLTGGTITTTGTLVLDSAVVFSRIRDSIVDVAIGNDTIKILKQEYAPATTSVLTWTITPKFPIQLKQYILVFRNGQLLINDQYNLTDTNKITIVSNSFKAGANYTVVTVSGIGSVGTGVFPNPIYPDAGIALSTGSTWASSIPNNSTNWNTAFTDRLKWDGGSTGLTPSIGRTSLGGTTIGQSMFTLTNPSTISFPRFNADNTVTSRSAANFRTDIGAGTVTNVNVASGTPMSIANNTTTPEISMAAATGSVNGYLTLTDWTTFNNKQNALGFTPANSTITINTTSPLQGGGNLTSNRTLSILSASDVQSGIVSTTAQLFSGSKVFKHRLTADSLFYLNNTSPIPTAILGIDLTGGVNSVGKFTLGNGLSITSSTLLADTNLLITRFDTASMLTNYLRSGTAASTYLPLTGGTLTGDLYTKYLNTFAKTTYIPFDIGLGENLTNVSSAFRGGTIMVFPDSNLIGSSANVFLANKLFADEYSTFGSGMRNYAHQGGDSRYNSLALYTSGSGSKNTNRLYINFNGDIGINDDTPSYKLDVNGTLNATGATTLGSTLSVTSNITEAGNNVLTNLDTASLSSRIDSKFNSAGGTISGAVTLSTTTATPSSLLGKDGSNVVGNVRLTSPLTLAGDSLNLGTVPISKGGTGAESASVARTTLGVGYTFYSTTTGATISFSSNRVSLVITGTGSTTTIDLSTATSGRQYMIKNLSNASVVSGLSNVIPLTGGSPTTAILSAGNATPQWVTLVADGTNWHVMQSN